MPDKLKRTYNLNKDAYYIYAYKCHLEGTTFSEKLSRDICNSTNSHIRKNNMIISGNIAKVTVSLDVAAVQKIDSSQLQNKDYVDAIILSTISDRDIIDYLEKAYDYKEKKITKRKEPCIGFEKNYPKEVLDILSNYELTKDEYKILENIIFKVGNCRFRNVIKDIYILYLNDYSPGEMSELYNKTHRTMQTILKIMGINRDRFEAQAIAKTKRDYKAIANKGRVTLLKKNTFVKGSTQEQYLRDLLASTLPIHIKDCEIIVGVNSRSILDSGLEVDIPLIIIKNDIIYKFAIEYDGSFWHINEERDSNKDKLLVDKGYKIIRVGQAKSEGFKTEKQIKEYIEKSVDEICENIKKLIA